MHVKKVSIIVDDSLGRLREVPHRCHLALLLNRWRSLHILHARPYLRLTLSDTLVLVGLVLYSSCSCLSVLAAVTGHEDLALHLLLLLLLLWMLVGLFLASVDFIDGGRVYIKSVVHTRCHVSVLKFLASKAQIYCLNLFLTLARSLLHLLGLRLQLLQCHLTLTIVVGSTDIVNIELLIHICIALVVSVARLMTMLLLLLLLLQGRSLVMLRRTQSLSLLLLCRVTNLLAGHGLRGRLFFVLILYDIVALWGGTV